jgi:hypothetical protein
VDAVSDLYMNVRWVPDHEVADVLAARRAGRTFIHPFKQVDALHAIG